MKNETIDSISSKVRMSHQILFWCSLEIDKNERLLFLELSNEKPDKDSISLIRKKLKNLYNKSGFESKELSKLKKLYQSIKVNNLNL